jgi:hypothetical protein
MAPEAGRADCRSRTSELFLDLNCFHSDASVIKCCYAARGIPGSWRVIEVAGYTNTTATCSDGSSLTESF